MNIYLYNNIYIYMSLNIEDYNTLELLEILNINPPINNKKIKDGLRNIISNKKLNEKQLNFFYNVGKKLINEIRKNNDEQYEKLVEIDDSDAGKLFKNELIIPRDNNLVKKRDALTASHNTILKEKIKSVNVVNKEVVQGENNPYRINTLKRQITFDSQFRRILDASACFCNNTDTENLCNIGSKQTNMYLDFSTDYTVNLNEPIYNVVDITLLNAEIPYTWDVFSKDYGTNEFIIKNNDIEKEIKIEDGNYSDIEIITQINNKIIEEIGENKIRLELLNYSKKVKIINEDDIDYELLWYNKKDNECGSNNTGFGSKVNYNLGWLLGFRNESITLSSNTSITAIGKLDTNGPSYFYISLDDFNNNKPNSDLISLIDDSIGNFQIPKYYNKMWHNISLKCPEKWDNIMGSKQEMGCSVKPQNMSRADHLTKKQQYAAEQIIEARRQGGVNRYNSPNTPDILAKIPLIVDKTLNKIFYIPNDTNILKRKYFGPTTLRKFRVKLITDKGLIVNLNNTDWSFSIMATTLYQY